MKKLVLTYGCIAGAIVSAMMLITFGGSMINMENGEIIGYSTMIIAFSTIFFAIRSYRESELQGQSPLAKHSKLESPSPWLQPSSM